MICRTLLPHRPQTSQFLVIAKRKSTLDQLQTPLQSNTLRSKQQMYMVGHDDKRMQHVTLPIMLQHLKEQLCGTIHLEYPAPISTVRRDKECPKVMGPLDRKHNTLSG